MSGMKPTHKVIFLSFAIILASITTAQAATFENTWFSSQPHHMFTIQLIGINGDKEFSEKIARSAPDETTTAVLTYGEEYVVVHGIYEKPFEAERAITGLPEKSKKYDPQVRKVAHILAMEGYDAPKSGTEVLSGLAGQAADAIANIGDKDPNAEISNFGPVPIRVNKPQSAGANPIPSHDAIKQFKDIVAATTEVKPDSEGIKIGAREVESERYPARSPKDTEATANKSTDEYSQLEEMNSEVTLREEPAATIGGVVTDSSPINSDSITTEIPEKASESATNSMAVGETNTDSEKQVAAPDKFVDPPQIERAQKKKPASSSVANANPFKELVINPERGVTELLVISRQHLNRIRTNFKEPIVTTIDDVEFKISDSTIYVSTSSTSPIALFISDGGAEETTVGMSLLPKSNVPPQQVYLNTTLSKHRPEPEPEAVKLEGDRQKAHNYEIKDPYTKVIMSLLKTVADGDIPTGYSLIETREHEREPLCNQPGIHYQFKSPGQQVVGDSFTVAIGVATNVGDHPTEAIEEYCVGGQTAAVAFWPDVLLNPGASTEVYVVVKNWIVEKQYQTRERPNLLGRR